MPQDQAPFLERWRDLCQASYALLMPSGAGSDAEAHTLLLDASAAVTRYTTTLSPVSPGYRYALQEHASTELEERGLLARIAALADAYGSVPVDEVPQAWVRSFRCQDEFRDDHRVLMACFDAVSKEFYGK